MRAFALERAGLIGLSILAQTSLVLAAPFSGTAPVATATDPFLWLEKLQSPRASAWVAAENRHTRARLEGDPRYQSFRAEALAVFTSQNRIAYPEDVRAAGIDNFWQSRADPSGVWRYATLHSYLTAKPRWTTLLNVGELARRERRNWVWKGAYCDPARSSRCLVALSDGGADASVLREFDTDSRRFVHGGLDFPKSVQYAAWMGPDSAAISRVWNPGETTRAGYPYIVKLATRGEPLSEAPELFRGAPGDVEVIPYTFFDASGHLSALVIQRRVSFYDLQYWLVATGAGISRPAVRIPLPQQATIQAAVDGQLVFTIESDWRGHPAGSVLAYETGELRAAGSRATPHSVFALASHLGVMGVAATRTHLVIHALQDVRSKILVLRRGAHAWVQEEIRFPADLTLSIAATSEKSDDFWVVSEGFLDPPSLWRIDGRTGEARRVKSASPEFDTSGLETRQFWASSPDGTQIPYFTVYPRARAGSGDIPTLLFAYGGFESSRLPYYDPALGKLWLQRGGAYVLANIRGGGEFGPKWHAAAILSHRQRAFDDFAAVARDLVHRKLTSARRLGIFGRSNGGVLDSVSMTQHPELFHAVAMENPLIDMLRYTALSAGSSWIGEFGNPAVPSDAVYLARYSAYQHVERGIRYPDAYVLTNLKDDRVHPAHARKFCAKLQSVGAGCLFYEGSSGGHMDDSDPVMYAEKSARLYVFLSQELFDAGSSAAADAVRSGASPRRLQ